MYFEVTFILKENEISSNLRVGHKQVLKRIELWVTVGWGLRYARPYPNPKTFMPYPYQNYKRVMVGLGFL